MSCESISADTVSVFSEVISCQREIDLFLSTSSCWWSVQSCGKSCVGVPEVWCEACLTSAFCLRADWFIDVPSVLDAVMCYIVSSGFVGLAVEDTLLLQSRNSLVIITAELSF